MTPDRTEAALRQSQRTIEQLERRIAELERRTGNLPVRWHVSNGGEDWVRLKIFGNKTAGGAYRAYLWTSTTTELNVYASGAIAAASIGSQGAEVVAINLPEIGQNTHDLTSGTPKAMLFWAKKATYATVEDEAVYEIVAYDYTDCP